jgi:hypothetical protein
MKSSLFRSIVMGFAAVSISAAAHAASIGIQFAQSSKPELFLAAGDTAGASGVAQTNWNPLAANFTTASDFKDSTGTTITGTSLSRSGGGEYFAGNGFADGTGDRKLASSSILAAFGGTVSVTLSGIPYATYDVYVYGENDAAGRYTSIGDGTSHVSFGTTSTASSWIPGTGTWDGTGTADSDPVANYARFTGETSSSLTITWKSQGNSGVNGIQIVQSVPEPGSAGMIGGLAGLLCLFMRRRGHLNGA